MTSPPRNVPRLLREIATGPERRVVVEPCTLEQVRTLPGWQGRDDLFYVDLERRRGVVWPEERSYWLIVTHQTLCPVWTDRTRRDALVFERVVPRGGTSSLWSVVMPDQADLPDRGAPAERRMRS